MAKLLMLLVGFGKTEVMQRLEIYGGLEAYVPADWGYGSSCWPPCVPQPRGPYVGRPGMIPLVGCGIPVPPLAERMPYLWFDSLEAQPGLRHFDFGWMSETRIVAGLQVTVFTDDSALRDRLLASVRPSADCPTHHPIIENPSARPDPGLDLLGDVESITVYRFAIGEVAERMRKRLPSPVLAISQITGETAADVVRAIRAAPEGSGPNRPENGPPHGNEMLVLAVRDGIRTQEVFVRYSGCDGHGFDDGRTHRWLTADALRPLFAGPHWPTFAGHTAIFEMLWSRGALSRDGAPPRTDYRRT